MKISPHRTSYAYKLLFKYQIHRSVIKLSEMKLSGYYFIRLVGLQLPHCSKWYSITYVYLKFYSLQTFVSHANKEMKGMKENSRHYHCLLSKQRTQPAVWKESGLRWPLKQKWKPYFRAVRCLTHLFYRFHSSSSFCHSSQRKRVEKNSKFHVKRCNLLLLISSNPTTVKLYKSRKQSY